MNLYQTCRRMCSALRLGQLTVTDDVLPHMTTGYLRGVGLLLTDDDNPESLRQSLRMARRYMRCPEKFRCWLDRTADLYNDRTGLDLTDVEFVELYDAFEFGYTPAQWVDDDVQRYGLQEL